VAESAAAEGGARAPALWEKPWVKPAAAALLLVAALVVGLLLGGLGKGTDNAKGPGEAGQKDNRPAKSNPETSGPPVVTLNEAALVSLQKTVDGLVDAFVVPELVENVGDKKLLKELREQLKELADLPRDRDGEKAAARLAEIAEKIDALGRRMRAARARLTGPSPEAEKKRALLSIWADGLGDQPPDPQKRTERWLEDRLLLQAAARGVREPDLGELKEAFRLLRRVEKFKSLAGVRKQITDKVLDFYAEQRALERQGKAAGRNAYAKGLRALGKSIHDNVAELRSKTGIGE
jgi:hypothetical protein